MGRRPDELERILSRLIGKEGEETRRMRRVFLFLATNIAILVVLSISLRLLGVDSLLERDGVNLDMQALLILSVVFMGLVR